MDENKINTKLLLKSSFWYTISNFLTRAMVFITMPLFTRLMTKKQYGDFTVFATWQIILVIICGVEVYTTVNRARFDYKEEGELDGYISSSMVLSTTVTFCLFVLYLAFPQIFDRFFLLDRKYMMLMFAYLFTMPAFSMFQAKQRIEYKYKLNAVLSFSILFMSYVLAVILVFMMPSDRLLGRIIGIYGLYIIAGLAFYIYFLHNSHRITLSAWKYALRLGLPLVFTFLGSQVFLSSDTLVLKHMCSAEEVAYLSVTQSCSHIMLILVQTLNTAWAPWLFDMLRINETGQIKKIFRIYMWVIVGGTFTVLLFGPEIIMILAGSEYSESMYILPANILCGILTVITSQFVNIETYHKKTEYAGILTAVMAVLNIILNIIGVKLFGYRAVCYTTVLCQVLLIALHYVFTQKMQIRELLSVKDLVYVLCASLLLIPVCLLLYQQSVIRYAFAAVMVICIVVLLALKWKDIKPMIRMFIKKDADADAV